MAAVTVRSATAEDYPAFVRFFAELGVDDPVPPRDAWSATNAPATLFLEEDGVPVAYGLSHPLREMGYVFHVVVDPRRRGERLGARMMEALAARLRRLGCTRWCLNVKRDNTAAIRLYERVGMRRAYASTSFVLPWSTLDALPAPCGTIEGRIAEPNEDAALEAAFRMPPGRLTQQRSQPGRILLRLVDSAHPDDAGVGLACFVPTFPGAFPFRVATPDLAKPLLLAMRPHARPEDATVQIVVEDDEPLTSLLAACGAAIRFELYHFEGELPAASQVEG